MLSLRRVRHLRTLSGHSARFSQLCSAIRSSAWGRVALFEQRVREFATGPDAKDDPKQLYRDQNDTWVDRHAPKWLQPYLKLSRVDRPIGTWLVLWPGWWGVAMAAPPGTTPDWAMLGVFAVGAFMMRGAGCTVNDMWDRPFDGAVSRTSQRPLVSGQVSMPRAWTWLGLQLSVALWALLQLNPNTIQLGVASLALVGVYPFMKRVTFWPQVVLGMAMNYGILMGWSAVQGSLSFYILPMYAGAVCWTIAYDTIYAHQDKPDDQKLGLKSTAILFGERTKPILSCFAAAFAGGLATSGMMLGLGWPYFVGVGACSSHLLWQIWTADFADRWNLTNRFVSNQYIGGTMFAAAIGGHVFQTLAGMPH